MDDWDLNGPTLAANLQQLLREIRDQALRRLALDLAAFRNWHVAMMQSLRVPPGAAVGIFRGEPPLEACEVRIGRHYGTRADNVAADLTRFETTLGTVIARLDQIVPRQKSPDEDSLDAVIETAAWAHSEWIRIHPFANGNGRIARLLANALAMRYGLPPFIRLRPRPEVPYSRIAEASMRGEWMPTVRLFHLLLDEFLNSPPNGV